MPSHPVPRRPGEEEEAINCPKSGHAGHIRMDRFYWTEEAGLYPGMCVYVFRMRSMYCVARTCLSVGYISQRQGQQRMRGLLCTLT